MNADDAAIDAFVSSWREAAAVRRRPQVVSARFEAAAEDLLAAHGGETRARAEAAIAGLRVELGLRRLSPPPRGG